MTAIQLLDCDTHFSDHVPALWERPAGRPALAVAPEILDVDGHQRLRLGDLVFPKPDGPGHGNPRGLGHLIGPGAEADRREFMDRHNIASAVLQPGFVGLSFQAVADRAARTALATAYNDAAARACADSGLDLRWGVLLSVEDPEWSLAELRRFAADPAVVGAVVRPTGRTADVRLNARGFTPVLELLARDGLALLVHGGTGCHQWSPLADAYSDYALTHAFGHMGEHMIALTDLLTRAEGLPDDLRVVMLESGVSWIPPLLERLALHHRRLAPGTPSPMDLMRRHVAVVPDPDERFAGAACETIGAANVLFGSDYPHWDTVDSSEWLKTYAGLCGPRTLLENTASFVPRLAAPPVGRTAS